MEVAALIWRASPLFHAALMVQELGLEEGQAAAANFLEAASGRRWSVSIYRSQTTKTRLSASRLLLLGGWWAPT